MRAGFLGSSGGSRRALDILIVHNSLSENGGVRLTLDLAERFAELGARVSVFAMHAVRDGHEAEVPPGVTLILGTPVGGRLRTNGPTAALRLLKASRRSHVVVSGSEVGLGLLCASGAARLARRPFAVIVHAPLDQAIAMWVPARLESLTRRMHRHADAAICVFPTLVADVLANGLSSDRVHVVPNAVDAKRVRRLAAAQPVPRRSVPTVIGLGRLSREKAFDLLIRAHADVRHAGIAHELELIGEGPQRERLLDLAAELGVTDSVSLTGFLRNPFPRLAQASVLVVPSRYEGGLSLATLEAITLGVPVIAARSAAAGSELLGAAVERVADDSVSALAAALRAHLEDPKASQVAARDAAASMGDLMFERAAAEYLRILHLLASRTRPVPNRT